jgi:hypothetical protein
MPSLHAATLGRTDAGTESHDSNCQYHREKVSRTVGQRGEIKSPTTKKHHNYYYIECHEYTTANGTRTSFAVTFALEPFRLTDRQVRMLARDVHFEFLGIK